MPLVTAREQILGAPWLVSAMLRLRMLGSYEEAELVAARIGASKMGFFKPKAPDEYTGPADEQGNLTMEVAPGQFKTLPTGFEFQTFDPQHPTQAFPFFVKACLRRHRERAERELQHPRQRPGRRELLQHPGRRFGRTRGIQSDSGLGWLVEQLHEPVFEHWLDWQLFTQSIPLPHNAPD